MGLTYVTIRVGNPANGHRAEDVSCFVDSAAVYSLIPGRVLRRRGIKPHSSREFVLANGGIAFIAHANAFRASSSSVRITF